jgi:hypothetical protein
MCVFVCAFVCVHVCVCVCAFVCLCVTTHVKPARDHPPLDDLKISLSLFLPFSLSRCSGSWRCTASFSSKELLGCTRGYRFGGEEAKDYKKAIGMIRYLRLHSFLALA